MTPFPSCTHAKSRISDPCSLSRYPIKNETHCIQKTPYPLASPIGRLNSIIVVQLRVHYASNHLVDGVYHSLQIIFAYASITVQIVKLKCNYG